LPLKIAKWETGETGIGKLAKWEIDEMGKREMGRHRNFIKLGLK
jgi:hypothetical protein